MKSKWEFNEARSDLERVIDAARNDGPQIIVKDGKETAIIISIEAYHRRESGGQSLSKFLQDSPMAGMDLDFGRDQSPARD